MLPHQLLTCFSTASLFQDAHCPFSGGWRGCRCCGRYWPWKTAKGDSFPLVAISPAENAGHFLQVWDCGESRTIFNASSRFLLQKWCSSPTMTDTQTTSGVLDLKEGKQCHGVPRTSRWQSEGNLFSSLGPRDVTVKSRQAGVRINSLVVSFQIPLLKSLSYLLQMAILIWGEVSHPVTHKPPTLGPTQKLELNYIWSKHRKFGLHVWAWDG